MMKSCMFLGLFSALVLTAAGPAAADTVILNTDGFWRCCYAGGTDIVLTKDGTLIPVHPSRPRGSIRKMVDGKMKSVGQPRAHSATRTWAVPPADWMSADFDDGAWSRLRGPFLIGKHGAYRSAPMACLRGKFNVANPARATGLTLSVAYHGGIVVYVNGKELTRRHLPRGKLKPDTPAESYPPEAFIDDEGFLLYSGRYAKKKDLEKFAEGARKRLREIKELKIPAAMLVKGVNVLALELHRSPAHEAMFMRKAKAMRWNLIKHTIRAWWPRVGVKSVELRAPTGAPVAGATGRPKGFQVWTAPVYQELSPSDYGDPCDSPGRVRLCTGRNGVCSGQVVASSNTPFKGLKVAISALTGPGIIPASAVQLRYARTGWFRGHRKPPVFMELEDFPQDSGAFQPVWLTVRVPADAKPGNYEGKVTVSASGRKPVEVPVNLRVVDWKVPDPKDFMSFLELIQSPESVAMHYKVEMWSQKHWELLDRTFKLLGEVGNDMLWITAQRKTHFGNEHAMIRFRKQGGKLVPDLSIAEKYLAMAVKHMGRMRIVSLYCYRCPWGPGMHYGQHKGKDLPVLISVLGADGKLQEVEGPKWGTPECVALWKPVFDGMKKLLAKHGIPAERLMIGATGDVPPSDIALDTIKQASGGLKWIFESHVSRTMLGTKQDHPVGYVSRAWGGDGAHMDPDFGRGYGWKNNFRPWRTVNREGFDNQPLPLLRVRLEAMVTNIIHAPRVGGNKDYGTHGIGRLGADFWKVLADKRGRRKHEFADAIPRPPGDNSRSPAAESTSCGPAATGPSARPKSRCSAKAHRKSRPASSSRRPWRTRPGGQSSGRNWPTARRSSSTTARAWPNAARSASRFATGEASWPSASRSTPKNSTPWPPRWPRNWE